MKRQLSHLAALVFPATAILILSVGPVRAEAQLVMAEEMGCIWCAMWDRDVAPIYPKTAEGRAAPLRRINIHDDVPADLNFDSKIVYTPTFILVDDGEEVARIEGYPGEDFFWGLLGQMLKEAGISDDRPG